MFLVGIFKWWYGDGWRARIQIFRQRIASTSDFFSVGILVSTLFAPYRQISAAKVSGSISDQIRAFGDRMISRTIGAVVRSVMIFIGTVTIASQALFGLIVLGFWFVLPTLPVVGLVMTVIGWVPLWKI